VTVAERKQRVRERSEYALRLAAMNDVGRRYPGRVTQSALPQEIAFLRYVFVPLYRRVPWSFKHKAMHVLRMTARNWPEGARRFGEPWRPPLSATAAGSGASRERPWGAPARPLEAPGAEH
jgi:hypothetical protein